MDRNGMNTEVIFFFKQKTAYEIYQCDWSSDVCSSDLGIVEQGHHRILAAIENGQTTIKGRIDLTKAQLKEIGRASCRERV